MSEEPSPKRLKADEGDVGEAGDGAELEQVAEERLATELDEVQKALDKVNDEASDRVLAVEQEYNKKRRPIYTQRADIIRRVPLFWQRTLCSHPSLADQLTDEDTQVLEFMTELDVVDFDDIKSGFKIVLTFAPTNPYFSNASLTKAFHYGDDGRVTIEPCTIDWKEGMAPNFDGGAPSYIFFTWMTTAEPIGEGTPDEIAEVLKDEIWPNPVKYYFNDLPPHDFEGAEGEEGPDVEFVEEEMEVLAGEEGEEGEGEEGMDDPEVVYEGEGGEGEEGAGDGEEGFEGGEDEA
ncbi:hypothetical protein HYH03_010890 [Edaphochlamys debaryana]|uniref:Nucleosome assembly protein n=1 Tax=Edaphochlamys debaryana TaxID=47281 RepID=A0A836BVS8_9CHLO|nr:hypothetical protein HYH03_010890 [Edaphochlamys debaryana]|eukprot:KAG2490735.1 hypothetical protein HYH03_010890 [Edaphochlamys debaryana]